jgi:hypothetical protein
VARVRYGLEGKLIDFGKQTEVPVRDLVLELLEFCGLRSRRTRNRETTSITFTRSSNVAPSRSTAFRCIVRQRPQSRCRRPDSK